MDERVDRTELDHETPPLSEPTRVRRRVKWWALFLLLVLAGLALWLGLGHQSPQQAGRGAQTAAAQPVES